MLPQRVMTAWAMRRSIRAHGQTVFVGDALTTDEPPWPRLGDDPAELSEGSWLVACVGFTFDAPWSGYAEGFLRLADEGVASVERSGRGHDFLVYPILFNYRHYIELALKQIISQAHELLGIDEPPPRTHKLTSLWNAAEAALGQAVSDACDEFPSVRACLERFDQLDPNSEGFRYPVTSKGARTLGGVRAIDLGQVRDVVHRLEPFFWAAAAELDRRIEFEQEIARARASVW